MTRGAAYIVLFAPFVSHLSWRFSLDLTGGVGSPNARFWSLAGSRFSVSRLVW
jgi:hypothetical protein